MDSIITRDAAVRALRLWSDDSRVREKFNMNRFFAPDGALLRSAVGCGADPADARFALYAVGRARQRATRAGEGPPFPELGQTADWWYLAAGVLPALLFVRVDFHRLLSHALTFEEIVLLAQRRVPGGRERDLECILDRRKPPPLTLGMRRWLGMTAAAVNRGPPSPGTPSFCDVEDPEQHAILVVDSPEPTPTDLARPEEASFEVSAGELEKHRREIRKSAVAAARRIRSSKGAAAAAEDDQEWRADSDQESTDNDEADRPVAKRAKTATRAKPRKTRSHRANLEGPYKEVLQLLESRFNAKSVNKHAIWLNTVQSYMEKLGNRPTSDDSPNEELVRIISSGIAGSHVHMIEAARGTMFVIDRFPGFLNCPPCVPYKIHHCISSEALRIGGFAYAIDRLRPQHCSQATLDAAEKLRIDLLEAELRFSAQTHTAPAGSHHSIGHSGYHIFRSLDGPCEFQDCRAPSTHLNDGGLVACRVHAIIACVHPKCPKAGKPYRLDGGGRAVVRSWCEDHLRPGWAPHWKR